MSRLALGTAQFGLDYGITNARGKVGEEEARSIVQTAARSGIDTIDTALLYGDSESVIGRSMAADTDFRIVTKTAKFGSVEASDAVHALRNGFRASLEALHRPKVFGLLIHDPADLLGPLGPDLWRSMQELRNEGLVERIGVSVYEPSEVSRLLDLCDLDLVQLPFNALDRRFAEEGLLKRLAGAGVEVHARSIFLQGLLLAPVDQVPATLEPVRAAVQDLDIFFADRGLSRLEGTLALVLAEPTVARFVIGVTSTQELNFIVQAAERARDVELTDMPELPAIDPRYLDPSRWGLAQ